MDNSEYENRAQEVGRILDVTYKNTLAMKTSEIVPTYDSALTLCLEIAASRAEEMEVMRRFAEGKMMAMGGRQDASFEQIDKLHHDLLQLGYSNLEREGTMEICFVRFCVARQQLNIAQDTLRHLHAKLRNYADLIRELKKATEDLMSEFPKD